jgi:alpha-ribazole phosphatase
MWNWSETKINLILIRHGETPSNSFGRYLGRTDEELSEAGKEKVITNKLAGKYPKRELVFSSPMKRCIQTAELIYNCGNPILIEEWREMDFGRFEGKNYEELKEDRQYQAWIDSNGVLPFPEGESREEFQIRCKKGLKKLLGSLEQEEREVPPTAAAIVHGGSIMALLSAYCGGDYFDYQCKNGEGYECTLIRRGRELRMEIIRKL